MHQSPARSFPEATDQRPVGPHPPVTLYRRAPNLPKRHTKTGLHDKIINQNYDCNSTLPELVIFFFLL
jgi:hypothetical protein